MSGPPISYLVDLNALEMLDHIREAFIQGDVDISVAGELEEVEIALGVRERRSTPPPNYDWLGLPPPDQPFRNQDKVGRNEPCPCGSGKKYKKCCLNKA